MNLKKYDKHDAPMLIVLGQSNAHGHGTILNDFEKVENPYNNVLGLKQTYNQSYDIKDVVWSNFETQGMNLGEKQDNTCCVISEFARLWQRDIDGGKGLPDLYVIQISVGSQGIDKDEKNGLNMWYTKREPRIRSGTLNEVNISLYPLAIHILEHAVKNLKAAGKNPIILGIHWNQWETEVVSGDEILKRAKENYIEIFEGFYSALSCRCRTYLYRPLSEVYHNEEGRKYISDTFDELENTYDNIKVIDIRHSFLWDDNCINKGIFQNDLVHYSNEAQRWFAKYQYKEVFGNNIIVLGDSVTDDGRYISFLNTYMKLYRPKDNINFINIGVSSENVTGLTEKEHPFPRPCILDRIERVVGFVDTDMIIICYGMNDGIYHPFDKDRFSKYKEAMTELVNKILEKGINLCIMTPPPFDKESFQGEKRSLDSSNFSYKIPYNDYNDVLKKYSEWIINNFKDKVYSVIDLHSVLYNDIMNLREKNAEYVSGDGIHPNKHGHYIIAKTILGELLHINLEEFGQIIDNVGSEIYHLFEQRDDIFHSYYKETIGHDNPYKNEVFSKDEMNRRLTALDKEIMGYMNSHKELFLNISKWNGFRTEKFYFKGYEVTIAMPKEMNRKNPWIYRTEFFGAFAYVDLDMLNKGYCVAYIKISNLYGAPSAVHIMEQFRNMMVRKYDLNEKPILFGFSRGGLYALHYAAEYHSHVSKIYFDAPVVNINCWPAKLNCGNSKEWDECSNIWGVNSDVFSFEQIMNNAIDKIINAQIPIIIVAGDSDEVVPYKENGLIIEEKYKQSNVMFKAIIKCGVGHHPHSLENVNEIVEFLII